MRWKLFQAAIAGIIIVMSIEYEWQADGLAIGVVAGMAAYYATGFASALISLGRRIAGQSEPRQSLPSVGHLDAWASEVGLRDRIGRGGS